MSTATGSAPPRSVAPPAANPTGSWDWPLAITTLLLMAFGLIMITSASSLDADAKYGDASHFVVRQAAGLAMGLVVAGAIVYSPMRWIRRGTYPFYGIVVGLLYLVMSPFGHQAKGAARWIQLGPVNLQPSELAKLAIITVFAHFLANNEGRLRDWAGTLVPGLALLVPPVIAIVFQKDFGTTVILFGLTGVLLFIAGLQWRWLIAIGALGVAGLGLLVAIEPYRIQRLISFVDPFADPDGAGYQVVQGWIALATGGLSGNGIASGVAQRGFLPEAHNDFIAAVIGEELGAVGWVFMVGLLLMLIGRAVAIARRAPDLYGLLAATGVATLFGAQTIINLGVVGGVLPAKGLVLPFLSYGPSAALVDAACVGLLLRLSMERPAPSTAPAPAPAPAGNPSLALAGR